MTCLDNIKIVLREENARTWLSHFTENWVYLMIVVNMAVVIRIP
jgi:hypothetical protein